MCVCVRALVCIALFTCFSLNFLPSQIAAVQEEIRQLYDMRMARNKPTDDKLAMFRQQVNCVLRFAPQCGQTKRKLHVKV